jgi:hypothetical protein
VFACAAAAPRRHGHRFRTWETHTGQRSLDLQTAGNPRLEQPWRPERLDDRLLTLLSKYDNALPA